MSGIGKEVVSLLQEGEDDLIGAAKAGWQVVEDALEALEPELKADLTGLLKLLTTSIEGGRTVDELVTALLNLAEANGKTFVIELGTDVLNGLVAALLASL